MALLFQAGSEPAQRCFICRDDYFVQVQLKLLLWSRSLAAFHPHISLALHRSIPLSLQPSVPAPLSRFIPPSFHPYIPLSLHSSFPPSLSLSISPSLCPSIPFCLHPVVPSSLPPSPSLSRAGRARCSTQRPPLGRASPGVAMATAALLSAHARPLRRLPAGPGLRRRDGAVRAGVRERRACGRVQAVSPGKGRKRARGRESPAVGCGEGCALGRGAREARLAPSARDGTAATGHPGKSGRGAGGERQLGPGGAGAGGVGGPLFDLVTL